MHSSDKKQSTDRGQGDNYENARIALNKKVGWFHSLPSGAEEWRQLLKYKNGIRSLTWGVGFFVAILSFEELMEH